MNANGDIEGIATNLPAGGSGLGTNLFVNGTLQQPARLTNAPAATTGRVLFVVNANGDIEGIATNLPAGGGGGLGTNLVVNGALQQPARLTNAPAATTGGLRFLINGNGDIEGYATNLPNVSGQTALVHKVIGTSMFIYTNSASVGQFQWITNTGVITNAVGSGTGSSSPLQITYDLTGVSTTNYVVYVDAEGTSGVWGSTYWIEAGNRSTSQFKLSIGSAAGSTTFAGNGYTYRVTLYELATVGGSSIVESNLTKTLMYWSAREYIPDASNAATFSSRSVGGALVPSITFDPTTQQGTSFEGVMPDEAINLTSGVAVKLFWSTPLAAAGSNVVWSVTVTNLCCGNTSNQTVLITNAPSGVSNEITNSVALLSSLTTLTPAGLVKVGVQRVAGSASDVLTLTNELRAVKLYLP